MNKFLFSNPEKVASRKREREREREKRVRERDNYYINNANRRMKIERSLHVNKRVPREGDRVGKSERGGGKRFCVWDARCVCLLSDGGTKEVD